MARMLQKPVFALPGCQQISVNTLWCDTLGLAENVLPARLQKLVSDIFLTFAGKS